MTKRVLIVDDTDANIDMLESLCKGMGLQATTAKNGKEALIKAQQCPPDLIITDILMPVMDGYTLCRRWKCDEQLRTVPFVFYTATYTQAKDEELALSLGADRFLIKPLEPLQLMAVMQELLEDNGRKKRAIAMPFDEEMEFFRKHNEVLFQKLEKKMLDLEAANQSLKLLEERYRLIFESVNDVIVTLDPELFLLNVSPSIERVLGYTAEELIGKAVKDLVRIIPPQWIDQAVQDIQSILKGETVQAKIYPIVAKNGTTVQVEINGSPIYNDGRIVGLISVIRDITRRMQAEAALQESEEKIKRIVNSVQDIIYSVDGRTGEFTFLSPAFERLLGYTLQDVLHMGGRRIFLSQVIQDGLFDPQNDQFEKLRLGEKMQPPTWEAWWRCKSGALICLEDRSFAFYDGSDFKGTQGILRDITKRKHDEKERDRLQAQLWASQKMEAVGRLAGGVAHDFNNLLSVILNFTGFVLDEMLENDPRRKDLLEVQKSGEMAVSLTRQLLIFSRRQEVEPQPLDLNRVVSGIERMLCRIIGEDIQLKIFPASDLGMTMADPGQVEQVIMNLVVNARDAMPQGGQITLTTSNVRLDKEYAACHGDVTAGDYVLIAVTDTGCGMDPLTQEQIFEPFFTTKERGKGTGLGLSTVYGIVKQSKGHIRVYSEMGLGTTFKVYFPRVMDVSMEEAQEPVVVPLLQGTETILVVEDDAVVLALTQRILEGAGYTVLTATGGLEAIQIHQAHKNTVHLVITDVVMPQMNGGQLARSLESSQPGIKILYTSGYTEDVIGRYDVNRSNANFLIKPFTAADLTWKVRQLLDSPHS